MFAYLQPEEDSDDREARIGGGGELVVAGGNGSVLPEAVDEALNAVALPGGGTVEARMWALVAPGRDHRPDAPATQVPARRRAAGALVPDHALRPQPGWPPTRPPHRPTVQQRRQRVLLVTLPTRQHPGEGLAASLGAQVELGSPAATAATEGLIAPFFAPAAWGCARIDVPSTKCRAQSSSPAAFPSAWSAARTRSQTPARCQRRKRKYAVCHGPERSGGSRHGAPVRSRYRIASMMVRCSRFGLPVAGFSGGRWGISFAHCSSVSSRRSSMPQGYPTYANTAQMEPDRSSPEVTTRRTIRAPCRGR